MSQSAQPNEPAELDLTGDPIVYDSVPQSYWEVMLQHLALLAGTELEDWPVGGGKVMRELNPREQQLAELILVDEIFRLQGTAIPLPERTSTCQHIDRYLKSIRNMVHGRSNQGLIESTATWFKDYARAKVTLYPTAQPAEYMVLAYTTEIGGKLVNWRFGDSLWINLNVPTSAECHTLMETLVVQRLARQVRNVAVADNLHRKFCQDCLKDYQHLLGYRIRRRANIESVRADMRWLGRYGNNQLVLRHTSA